MRTRSDFVFGVFASLGVKMPLQTDTVHRDGGYGSMARLLDL
ncbi:hypothetical protein P9847_03185 [Paenibacillus chibensis]|uniref:Uncharacterized protein n=1 Tax=Paenibacillus chibensis TaxID=59846 RepID=A0ABU6PQ98_9BACL|nr:hypothetical protein [Paenibacillus chibensis]